MVNIILGILAIRLLINVVTRNIHHNSLNCGLWGYAGENSTKFDWLKFDVLGLENDKRGGDACGRVIGELSEHSNDFKTKRYPSLIKSFLPPKVKRKEKVVFGHARKASFVHKGKHGIEYAQPAVFYNTEKIDGEDGEVIHNHGIDFIFSHNGTLYNHEDLAKKYNVPTGEFFFEDDDMDLNQISGSMSDSQILGYILGYQKNFDVLTEYKGSAAFALYDYRSDRLYLWSGASLANDYSRFETEERPLNMIKSKNHVWFSSEFEPLAFINYSEDDEVEELDNNTLYVFENGVEIEAIHYDRSKKYQYNKTEKPKHTSKKVNKSSSNYKAVNDMYTECLICNGGGFYNGSVCEVCDGNGFHIKMKQLPEKVKTNLKDLTNAYTSPKSYKLFGEVIPLSRGAMINFARGRYYHDEKEMTGIYHISALGTVTEKICETEATYDWEVTKAYYFIKGNMMIGHKEFMTWITKLKKREFEDNNELADFSKMCLYPVFSEKSGRMIDNVGAGNYDYTGNYCPLFSYYIYSFKNGTFQVKEKLASGRNDPNHGVALLKEDKGSEDQQSTEESDLPFDKDKEFDCVACGDTGINSKGGICVACSNHDDQLTISYEDAENDFYEDTIKKELAEELSHLLNKIEEARSVTFVYSDHKIAVKVDEVLGEMKNELNNIIL